MDQDDVAYLAQTVQQDVVCGLGNQPGGAGAQVERYNLQPGWVDRQLVHIPQPAPRGSSDHLLVHQLGAEEDGAAGSRNESGRGGRASHPPRWTWPARWNL